jgi:branched-chain amino acid transport system permease protein
VHHEAPQLSAFFRGNPAKRGSPRFAFVENRREPFYANLEFFLISLLNGISYGLLLFMLSSGLTLIFSMMGVLNFAHASFYMLGAYFAYEVSQRLGFWPALVVAPLVVGLLGAIFEAQVLRRVHKFGHVPELLVTFGLAFIIFETVQLIWGRASVDYRIPEVLDHPLFTLYTTTFPAYRAFMMLVAVLMLISVYLVLTRTRIGLVIQGALSHPDMVEALGHNVPRVFMLVFGGGAALAGLAGVIGGNEFVTRPAMAEAVGNIIFVVVVVGGMGSLGGAFIASLLIGLIQTFAVSLDWSLGGLLTSLGASITPATPAYTLLKLTLSQFAPILPYMLLVLMLIFRPKGIMGTRED